MADVVRTGAIFRVKNPATMRSPMPRLPGTKLPRGRIAVATPDTPGAPLPASKKAALERVVSQTSGKHVIVAGSALFSPQTETQSTHTHNTKKKKKKKTHASIAGVVVPKKPTRPDHDDVQPVNLLARFDRILSSPDTPMGPVSDVASVVSSASDYSVKQRQRMRKRQRPQPEPEQTDDDADQSEPPTSTSSVEKQTSQPQGERRRSTSCSRSDSDDDRDRRVQKRLHYDDTPPRKRHVHCEKSPQESDATPAAKPAKRRRSPKPVSGGLEALLASAPTPARRTRIRTDVVTLSQWYIEWPPPFVADELQLVMRGRVRNGGARTAFTVQRHVTPTQFVTTENQNVKLDGCLDIESAQQAKVPPLVMELLLEGIPPHWRSRLEALAPPPDPMVPLLVPKSHKKDKTKATASASSTTESLETAANSKPKTTNKTTSTMTKPATVSSTKPATAAKPKARPSKVKEMSTVKAKSAATPMAKKKKTPNKATQPKASEEPETPVPERRSRSGRRLTPVMEWWRNERKVTTADFETKFVEGSPAYLPSTRGDESESPNKRLGTEAAREKMQALWDAQKQSIEWTEEQSTALRDAKVIVSTTDPNFWLKVASYVPGKTMEECRQRSFDELTLPPTRKAPAQSVKAASGATQVPTKIHRAGSNLFKKQVRQFVQELEHKTTDDLFAQSTPSKDAIVGADGLDELQSPGAPAMESPSKAHSDSSDDDEMIGGRELLEKVPESKRGEVDSYVRALMKGNSSLGVKAVRNRQTLTETELATPPAAKKPQRQGVYMTEMVNGRMVECIVTPGGTTRVRVEKDSDDEGDDEADREEEEEEEDALSDVYF